MSLPYIIGTMPVTLNNSEPIKQWGHKKLGKAFQDSLLRRGHKKAFIDITKSKTCTVCHVTMSLGEFRAHPTAKDGTRNKCKVCEGLQSKEKR